MGFDGYRLQAVRDWHGYTHTLPMLFKMVQNEPKIMKNSPEMAEI
jgi:hypothetical protein